MTERPGPPPEDISQEIQPKKEPMTDEEIGKHLTAIGNHEGRAGLLMAMEPGIHYSKIDLHRLLRARSNNAWPHHRKYNPSSWCDRSLVPAELVRTVPLDGTDDGYLLTDKGETAKALASNLIEFSLQHQPLKFYFGSLGGDAQARRGPPASLTRLRIFSKLVESDTPLTQKDLIDFLKNTDPQGYGESVQKLTSDYLNDLSRNNVITYRSHKASTSYAFYRPVGVPPETEIGSYRNETTLPQQVYQVITELTQGQPQAAGVSAKEIYALLISQFPKMGDRNAIDLKRAISGILREFQRHGFVQNVEGLNQGKQSEVFVDDEQRETLRELLAIVDNFRRGDARFIAEGKQKAEAMMVEPDFVAQLLGAAH